MSRDRRGQGRGCIEGQLAQLQPRDVLPRVRGQVDARAAKQDVDVVGVADDEVERRRRIERARLTAQAAEHQRRMATDATYARSIGRAVRNALAAGPRAFPPAAALPERAPASHQRDRITDFTSIGIGLDED